jgi:hypothetical protein
MKAVDVPLQSGMWNLNNWEVSTLKSTHFILGIIEKLVHIMIHIGSDDIKRLCGDRFLETIFSIYRKCKCKKGH